MSQASIFGTPKPSTPAQTADPSYPLFSNACRRMGAEVTPEQYDSLLRYAGLLRGWNRRINLISRRDVARVMTYHIADSLAVSRLIPANAKVCDIGTGAGLPGIPLAICRLDVTMVLVESSRKRCLFLESVVPELGLARTGIINDRAENIPTLGCDVALSRLSAPTAELVPAVAHHLAPQGILVLYKTKEPAAELARAARVLKKHSLCVMRSEDVRLPFTGIVRRFLIIGSN